MFVSQKEEKKGAGEKHLVSAHTRRAIDLAQVIVNCTFDNWQSKKSEVVFTLAVLPT